MRPFQTQTNPYLSRNKNFRLKTEIFKRKFALPAKERVGLISIRRHSIHQGRFKEQSYVFSVLVTPKTSLLDQALCLSLNIWKGLFNLLLSEIVIKYIFLIKLSDNTPSDRRLRDRANPCILSRAVRAHRRARDSKLLLLVASSLLVADAVASLGTFATSIVAT